MVIRPPFLYLPDKVWLGHPENFGSEIDKYFIPYVFSL